MLILMIMIIVLNMRVWNYAVIQRILRVGVVGVVTQDYQKPLVVTVMAMVLMDAVTVVQICQHV